MLIIFISSFPQLQSDDRILRVMFHRSHGRYVRFSHLLLFWGKCPLLAALLHVIKAFYKQLMNSPPDVDE